MTDLIAPERYEGVEKDSVGFKLMTSMGWAEGQGLGREKQGIKKHLTAKKKFDNLGVGTIENDKKRQDWTLQMVNFNAVLGKLSKVSSRHSMASMEDGEEDSDASGGAAEEEEEEEMEEKAGKGKKRKAAKAAATAEAKKNKKNKKQKKSDDAQEDGGKGKKKGKKGKKAADSSEDSEEERGGAKDVPSTSTDSKASKSVSHLGRFKKREKAKCVKSYSSTDLAAILGHKEEEDNPFAAFAAAATTRKAAPAAEEGSDSDSDAPEGARGKKSAPREAEDEGEEENPAVDFASPDDSTKWWAGMFCRAGVLGTKRVTEKDEKRGFSEADQENLYNTAHEKAIKGKQGLGRSSMPKKVAGVHFAGKKTKIVESDDDDEEGKTTEKAASDGGAEDGGGEKGAKKWKKIALRVLREGGGSMKMKQLKKRALEHAGVDKSGEAAAEAALLKRVGSSSAFQVDGKKVALAKPAK